MNRAVSPAPGRMRPRSSAAVSNARTTVVPTAHVLRPAAFEASLASLDDAKARAMPGVTVVRDGDFVGVAAPDLPTALHPSQPEPNPTANHHLSSLRPPQMGVPTGLTRGGEEVNTGRNRPSPPPINQS